MVEECYPQTSTLYFSESSTIGNNSAAHSGGETYVFNNTTFNFHEQLSQIKMVEEVLHRRTLYKFQWKRSFGNSSAALSGGEIFWYVNTLINFSVFRRNSANNDGGGIHVLYSNLNFIGNSIFINNSGGIAGGIYAKVGALSITRNGSDNIEKHSEGSSLCSSIISQGSWRSSVYRKQCLSFWGHTIFSGNSVQNSAGGIHSKNSALMFSGSTSFSSNSGQSLGWGIYAWVWNIVLLHWKQ